MKHIIPLKFLCSKWGHRTMSYKKTCFSCAERFSEVVARVSREHITWMTNWQLPIASYELPKFGLVQSKGEQSMFAVAN